MKAEDVPQEWVEAARAAMAAEIGGTATSFDDHARAALATVIPLVQAAERDRVLRAAKGEALPVACNTIAIRARNPA